MDIKKLEYFEAVSRLRSFTKAAEELHIAQPSITASINKLEDELGVALFVRNSRKVELTFEGELFRKKTLYLLKLFRETVDEMQALGSRARQVLHIGIPPMVGTQITPLLYGDFLPKHPEVTLDIYEDGSYAILEALKSDKIELGYIVLEESIEAKFNVYQTFQGEIHVLMNINHPLSKLDKIPIEMMKEVNLIHLPERTYIRKKIDAELAKVGLEPRILAVPDQMITTVNLVARNLGVCFVLGNSNNIVNERHTLTVRPFENPILFRTGFVWLKDRNLSEAARKCMKFMKERAF